jgi:MazG family protein
VSDPRTSPAPAPDPERIEPDRADLRRLVELVARLRAPDGCPWDREQTLADVRAYLLEEAHEAAAAIDAGDLEALAGELGDLLFQAAFVARLGEEAGAFSAGDAIDRSLAKMIARHPHVFGGEELADAAAVARAWERRKLEAGGGGGAPGGGLLDGVPASLPALTAAYRMTQKAAAVGFDWPDAGAVLAKVDEELAELRAELAGGGEPGAGPPAGVVGRGEPAAAFRGEPTGSAVGRGEPAATGRGEPPAGGAVGPAEAAGRDRARDEIGDLLFTVANLARKLGLDPEAALAAANAKFRRRFRRVEDGLAARGRRLGEASLDEMDALWTEAKAND